MRTPLRLSRAGAGAVLRSSGMLSSGMLSSGMLSSGMLSIGMLSIGMMALGCGHVEVNHLALRPGEVGAQRSRVELYMGAQKPEKPVYEVALLDAMASGDSASLEGVTKALSERGGQLGCDAVVRVRVEIGQSTAHGYGVCVRYAKESFAEPIPSKSKGAAGDESEDENPATPEGAPASDGQ